MKEDFKAVVFNETTQLLDSNLLFSITKNAERIILVGDNLFSLFLFCCLFSDNSSNANGVERNSIIDVFDAVKNESKHC